MAAAGRRCPAGLPSAGAHDHQRSPPPGPGRPQRGPPHQRCRPDRGRLGGRTHHAAAATRTGCARVDRQPAGRRTRRAVQATLAARVRAGVLRLLDPCERDLPGPAGGTDRAVDGTAMLTGGGAPAGVVGLCGPADPTATGTARDRCGPPRRDPPRGRAHGRTGDRAAVRGVGRPSRSPREAVGPRIARARPRDRSGPRALRPLRRPPGLRYRPVHRRPGGGAADVQRVDRDGGRPPDRCVETRPPVRRTSRPGSHTGRRRGGGTVKAAVRGRGQVGRSGRGDLPRAAAAAGSSGAAGSSSATPPVRGRRGRVGDVERHCLAVLGTRRR